MFNIDWDSISNADLVKLSQIAIDVINKRIETIKSEIYEWVSKFKSKESMVLAYMTTNKFTSEELVNDLFPFFHGTNKERVEQIKQIVIDLIKSGKVVKDGNTYSAK